MGGPLGSELDVNSVKNFVSFSKVGYKLNGARRFSGGITVLMKPEIRKGVKYVNTRCQFGIWMKFDKKYFNLINDIYICACYIPPEGSSVYTNNTDVNIDPYQLIEEDIIRYQELGDIMLMGDFNARTACNIDFIENDNDWLPNVELSQCYPRDIYISKRANHDTVTNKFGEKLLNLCKELQLRILNGHW